MYKKIKRIYLRGISDKLQVWAYHVKKGKRCNVCGSKKNLQAHHLYSKFYYPWLALLLSNGVPLCNKCHSGFHSWNGGFRVKATRYLYNKWKYRKLILFLRITIIITTLTLMLIKILN